MAAWQLLGYSGFRTIGKSALYLSQWCTLQAFVQATMWHNTEPKTLGVSFWATGLFVGALLLPGLLYLLASAVISASKSQSRQVTIGIQFFGFVARIIPALTLMCASLPYLDPLTSTRTWILGVGVVFSSFYIIFFSWPPHEHLGKKFLESTRKRTECPKNIAICTIFNVKAKSVFQKTFTAANIGGDALIATCATMGTRWCFSGLNVFYEHWQAPLALSLIVLIYAAVLLIWEQCCPKGILPSLIARRKLSKCDQDQSSDDNNREALPERNGERGNGGLDEGGESFLQANLHDSRAIKENGGAKSDENGGVEGQNGIVSISPSREDNSTYTSAAGSGVNSRSQCINTSYIASFAYAITLGPAIGAIAYTHIWIFTSPSILGLWGEIPDYPSGYIIFSCYSVGCLLAIITNLEPLCAIQYSDTNANGMEMKKIKRLQTWQWTTNLLLIVGVIMGTSLLLLTDRIPCLFGAAVLCLSSPLLLRTILVMTYDLVLTSKSLQVVGKRNCINILPGTLLLLSGITFVAFHLLSIMFVNPQFSSIVHGKISAVFVPQIVFSILPLVCGPLVKSRIRVLEVHLRSPSMGPLLASESPTLQRLGEHVPNGSNNLYGDFKLWRVRKYRKIAQISLILIIFLMSVISKHISLERNRNCLSELARFDNCISPDIRVMSWNILLGNKMNGRSNLEAIARLTDKYEPHVIALQEASGHLPFWGGKDIFGYLHDNTKSCREMGKVVNPRMGSFEVGMLSRFKILSKSAAVLPNGGAKVPSYTMAKISCQVSPICDIEGEIGSGSFENPSKNEYNLHIYTVHAVYKNWTCDRHSRLSCEQMQFIHDDIRKLPENEPVIVMGDFNINPSEPELDIWFQGDLGFKSAMWQESIRNASRANFNYSCGDIPQWDDATCDCECRDNSSDPPHRTLLNRNAAVDHIFYRGLRLIERARILNDIGNVSDHYPVLADFAFK